MALTTTGSALLCNYLKSGNGMKGYFIGVAISGDPAGQAVMSEEKNLAYGSVSNGKIALSASVVFNMAPGWSAQEFVLVFRDTGTVVAQIPLDADEPFPDGGTFNLTKLDIQFT